MPNYYVNRNNEMHKQRYPMEDNIYGMDEARRDKRVKSDENLIIDDNSVYEIDPECFKMVKQSRLNYRQDGLKDK